MIPEPILVTGAAGNIGSYFAEQAHRRYRLRLMVHHPTPQLEPYGEVVQADLADLERLKEVCAGIDTVVHLAGNPDPNAVWADLVTPNIFGCYNMMVAAKAAACRRVLALPVPSLGPLRHGRIVTGCRPEVPNRAGPW